MRVKKLKFALTFLGKVIKSKQVIPVIENIHVLGSKLHSTDINVWLIFDMHEHIGDDFLFPYKPVMKILRASDPTEKVKFSYDKENSNYKVSMTVGDCVYSLCGESPQDFPKMPELNFHDDRPMKLGYHDIKNFKAAYKYTSTDGLRPAMTGVFLDPKAGNIVSTDSHKLFYRKLSNNGFDKSVILPRAVMPVLGQYFEEVELQYGFNIARFKDRNLEIISRTIDERFPDYMNVIPKDKIIRLTLVRDAVISAVKKGLPVTNGFTHQMMLKFDKGGITISAEDLDFMNSFSCELDGEKKILDKKGDFDKIGVNGDYFLSALQASDDYYVNLDMEAANKAIILDESMLLMPVMITQK